MEAIRITGRATEREGAQVSDFGLWLLAAVVVLGLAAVAGAWIWNFTGQVDAQALSVLAGR